MVNLTKVKSGKEVVLVSVAGGRSAEQKLLDMGFIPGEKFEVINNSGFGPLTVQVKGSRLALGHGLASKLMVKED